MEWIQEVAIFFPQVLSATAGAIFRRINDKITNTRIAQSAGAVEYIDCFSAEE